MCRWQYLCTLHVCRATSFLYYYKADPRHIITEALERLTYTISFVTCIIFKQKQTYKCAFNGSLKNQATNLHTKNEEKKEKYFKMQAEQQSYLKNTSMSELLRE